MVVVSGLPATTSAGHRCGSGSHFWSPVPGRNRNGGPWVRFWWSEAGPGRSCPSTGGTRGRYYDRGVPPVSAAGAASCPECRDCRECRWKLRREGLQDQFRPGHAEESTGTHSHGNSPMGHRCGELSRNVRLAGRAEFALRWSARIASGPPAEPGVHTTAIFNPEFEGEIDPQSGHSGDQPSRGGPRPADACA